MAEASVLSLERKSKCEITSHNLESEVKKRLSWTKKDWQNTGEESSGMHKLINSMKYWHKMLGKAIGDKSVVLTLYNMEKRARLEILEIVDAIQELSKDIIIEGFSDFRNPRYIGIHFETENMRKLVEEKFRMVGDNYVVLLEWASQDVVHEVRVHWIPMGHNTKNISILLNKYLNIIEVTCEELTLMSGKKYKRGLLKFRGMLRENITLEMLPHLAVVDSFECLITVFGRQPLCLTCNRLGHRSANCLTPYCKKCKSLHHKESVCENTGKYISYAQKVKKGVGCSEESNLEAQLEGSNLLPILEQVSKEPLSKKNLLSSDYSDNVGIQKVKVSGNNGTGKFKESWGDYKESENSSVESEDESPEQNAVLIKNKRGRNSTGKQAMETEGLTKISEYLEQLQSLKLPNVNEARMLLENTAKIKEEIIGMEEGGQNLKRKSSSEPDFVTVLPKTSGSRKTYSRKNVTVKASGGNLSNNLFDLLLEGDNKE